MCLPPLTSKVLAILSLLVFYSSVTPAQTVDIREVSAPFDEKSIFALAGNVHPLARSEFDQGLVGDAQPLRRMLLFLQRSPQQEGALQGLLEEQQNKSSPNYRAWLTPEQFGRQFGPADADVQTLTRWLTAQGFTDIKVGPGRTAIEFSGTVANVRKAFHTEIHRYLVNGEEHIANASDPQIPAALAPVIGGIVSLHDFRKRPMYHLAGAPHASRATTVVESSAPEYSFSCADFFTHVFGAFSGQSTSCHPLGPYDFATIYNVLPLWNATSAIDGSADFSWITTGSLAIGTLVHYIWGYDAGSLSAMPRRHPTWGETQIVL